MVDTIKLMLDKTKIAMIDESRFEKGLANSERGYFTLVQNPTPAELKQGIYKPRLTITNRFNASGRSAKTLAIEFSAPKLVLGNNFDELTDSDFLSVVQKLQDVLKEMGVHVFENILINAPVSVIHYSKNIVLTDHTTPYTYLSQLTKININRQLDTNRTDFRNEGHSFKYRANSFEVVFYDKIRDLKQTKKSEKRAEEKDNALQLSLLDLLIQKEPLEVLRFEVRLNRRQKIKHILRKINKELEPTFANLFNQDIAKEVLLCFAKEIEEAYPPLLVYEYNSPKKLFEWLLIANPKLKPTQALELTAFRILLDEIGVREYRQIIQRHSDYYWYSLNRKMKKLKQTNEINISTMLKEQINKFEPVRLLANQDKMLNNDKNGK